MNFGMAKLDIFGNKQNTNDGVVSVLTSLTVNWFIHFLLDIQLQDLK